MADFVVNIAVSQEGEFAYEIVGPDSPEQQANNHQFVAKLNGKIRWNCHKDGDNARQFAILLDGNQPARLQEAHGPCCHGFLAHTGAPIDVKVASGPPRRERHKYHVVVVDREGNLWTDDPEFIIDP